MLADTCTGVRGLYIAGILALWLKSQSVHVNVHVALTVIVYVILSVDLLAGS